MNDLLHYLESTDNIFLNRTNITFLLLLFYHLISIKLLNRVIRTYGRIVKNLKLQRWIYFHHFRISLLYDLLKNYADA